MTPVDIREWADLTQSPKTAEMLRVFADVVEAAKNNGLQTLALQEALAQVAALKP